MASVNKTILIGNLTRDPETRYTPKGTAVGDISLACNRVSKDDQGNKREEVTYIDVTLWGKQAELAQQYLSKGRPVYIEGRLQMDTWQDKATGQNRSKLKVVGESMQFLGGREQESAPQQAQSKQHASGNYAPDNPTYTKAPVPSMDDDDDIPF